MCAHDANMQILDDGGVRGYSTLLILDEIMEAIIRREKSYPDSPAESSYHPLVPPTANLWLPCHYFDYIGGIGSGGLIAIMLGRLKMDVSNTILASEALLSEVFKTKRWLPVRTFWFWSREKYDHLILEKEIRKIVLQFAPSSPGFPEDYGFPFDENQCRTVVVAAGAEQRKRSRSLKELIILFVLRRKWEYLGRLTLGKPEYLGTLTLEKREMPYVFRTYNFSRGPNRGFAHHVPIWQVARATTATSSFLQPVFIDGRECYRGRSLEMDPSSMIYETVERECRSLGIILSIGCGQSIGVNERMLGVDGYMRLNVDNGLDQMKTDEWRARGHLRINMGSLIGSYRLKHRGDRTTPQQTAPQDQEPQNVTVAPKDSSSVAAAINSESNIPKLFLPKNITTEAIRKHTREYLDREDVQSKISEIADLLVEKRRDRVRCDPGRWEKFCFQTRYICKVPNCSRAGKDCGSRGALRWHILDKHYDRFSVQDQGRLEAALDQGQIRVS